jgi:hypothetical protein
MIGKLEHPGEVRIRRYEGFAQCDVVVTYRGREMVLELPDYNQAVRWAEMEAKTYGTTVDLSWSR